MAWHDDLRFHFGGTGHGRIKVVEFKPQEYAIAIGLVIWIPDRSVVVFDLEAVQFENQRALRDQSLIFRASVRALTAQETLIPLATRLDVGYRNEGLGTHQDLRCNSV